MLIQRMSTRNKNANIPMSSRNLLYLSDLKRKKMVERKRVTHQKPPTAGASDKRTQSMPRVVSMSHMLMLLSTPTVMMAVTASEKKCRGREVLIKELHVPKNGVRVREHANIQNKTNSSTTHHRTDEKR